jgi:two-component system nitrogen regulation response regulator NtrX
VLIVDDDAETREAFAALAEARGLDAVGARDAPQALDYLRHGARPCLILLDLYMPGMDGFAFRRQQLEDTALATIPTAIVSGGGPADEVAARSLGIVTFLRKPVDAGALLRLLAEYCDA